MRVAAFATLLLLAMAVALEARQLTQTQINNAAVSQSGGGNKATINQSNEASGGGNQPTTQINNAALAQAGKNNECNINQENKSNGREQKSKTGVLVKKPVPATLLVAKPCGCAPQTPTCSGEVAAACCDSYELACDAQYKPIHPQTCTVKKQFRTVDYTLKDDYNPLVWESDYDSCVCPQRAQKVVVQAQAEASATAGGGK